MLKWIFNKSTLFIGDNMKGKIVSLCYDKIKEIVEGLGFVLVDVEYKKQNSSMVLEVVIDKDGGVNIIDCEAVSHALDKPLDDIDPTNGASYNLNVSSMGLDRPITTPYQFDKYKGKEIEIKFYQNQKEFGGKNLIGDLIAWSEENVEVKTEDNTYKIERKNIAQIVPVIRF